MYRAQRIPYEDDGYYCISGRKVTIKTTVDDTQNVSSNLSSRPTKSLTSVANITAHTEPLDTAANSDGSSTVKHNEPNSFHSAKIGFTAELASNEQRHSSDGLVVQQIAPLTDEGENRGEELSSDGCVTAHANTCSATHSAIPVNLFSALTSLFNSLLRSKVSHPSGFVPTFLTNLYCKAYKECRYVASGAWCKVFHVEEVNFDIPCSSPYPAGLCYTGYSSN